MMFAPARQPPELTRRQHQVLTQAAHGNTGRQIADELGVTPRTIEEYLERLRSKLGARNTAHMCALAVADGLVDADELRATAVAAQALGIN